MEARTEDWWTGEDSNLRSPQGAAGLQPAAISHSATCPLLPPAQARVADLPNGVWHLPQARDLVLTRATSLQQKLVSFYLPRWIPFPPDRWPQSGYQGLERETGIEPATNSLEG